MEKMPQPGPAGHRIEGKNYLSEEQEMYLRKILPDLQAIVAESDMSKVDLAALTRISEGMKEHRMMPGYKTGVENYHELSNEIDRLKEQLEYYQRGENPPPHKHLGHWNFDKFRADLQEWIDAHRTYLEGSF